MAWLSAVTKLAPYAIDIGKVAVSALPHLTMRKSGASVEIADAPLRPEIVELQSAATQNAENIRKIAGDLSHALIAIEEGGKTIEARFRRLELLSYAAIVLSVLSIGVSAVLWLR